MNSNEPITVTRDVEGTVIPTGTKVHAAERRAGFHHAIARRHLHRHRQGQHVRIEAKDADALGLEVAAKACHPHASTAEEIEKKRGTRCGLLRPGNPGQHRGPGPGLRLPRRAARAPNRYKMGVKITLTAPGCGMGRP